MPYAASSDSHIRNSAHRFCTCGLESNEHTNYLKMIQKARAIIASWEFLTS